MKKNSFRLFAMVILSTTLSLFYSCSTPYNALKKNTVIGTNKLTNGKILADQFVFRDNIYDFYIDTTKQNITIRTRGFHRGHHPNGKGKLYQFDLLMQNYKWDKSFDYKKSILYQYDSLIILSKGKKNYRFNPENGKQQWKIKINMLPITNSKMTALGYENWLGLYDNIFGIDLNQGETLWYRKANFNYSCNEIRQLNDSISLVVAGGLHTYNLNDGTGWDFKESTGVTDYTSTIIANALGIGLGLYTGVFVITPGFSLVYDVVSNVIIDDSSIYWASSQKVIKLDHEGNLLWEYGLHKDDVSKSSIFIKDSVLYMLNFGLAYHNSANQLIRYGQPFLAGFDQNSGNEIFNQLLNNDQSPVLEYKIKNNELLLITPTRLSNYTINNGNLNKEKTINTDSLGYLDRFVDKNTFIKQDSVIKSLNDINSTSDYVITHKKTLLEINNKLEIVKQIKKYQPYICYLETDKYLFVGNSEETYILDKNHNTIANIKVPQNAKLIGTNLYGFKDKAMIIIDLKDIIEK